MYRWLTRNTNIDIQKYRETIGRRAILRQDLTMSGYSIEEIEARVYSYEYKKYNLDKKSKNTDLETIEKFTMLHSGELFHDLLLSRKMQVTKDGEDWVVNNIHFKILSDFYPNNSDILKSSVRSKFAFSDAIVLMVYYNGILTVAEETDFRGVPKLNAFVIVGDDVYDFSKNLIMAKETYFKKYKIKPFRTYTLEEYQDLKTKLNELVNVLKESSVEIDFFDYEFLCWPEEILGALTRIKEELETAERK